MQTLFRLNRAHPEKRDVFVLEIKNNTDTQAFSDYRFGANRIEVTRYDAHAASSFTLSLINGNPPDFNPDADFESPFLKRSYYPINSHIQLAGAFPSGWAGSAASTDKRWFKRGLEFIDNRDMGISARSSSETPGIHILALQSEPASRECGISIPQKIRTHLTCLCQAHPQAASKVSFETSPLRAKNSPSDS